MSFLGVVGTVVLVLIVLAVLGWLISWFISGIDLSH